MDDKEIIELLRAMVRAPSFPGVVRQEEETVRALEAYLLRRGIPSELAEIREGRPNLVATIEGRKPGPHILFCGHTDTVPPNAGSLVSFFSAAIENGRMFGRGTVDMKGALAAMAGALVEIRESGGLDSGRITLAAVIDEEMESVGAEALIGNGLKADGAIIGEPTENRVAIGHKGLEWLEARFTGKAVHGSMREAGIDAISAAARFISLVEKELIPGFERRRDPVLGLPAINMGTIRGGQQPSMVADDCRIQLDRRWVTTETIEQVFDDIEKLRAGSRGAPRAENPSGADAGRNGHDAPRPGHHRSGARARSGGLGGVQGRGPARPADHGLPGLDRWRPHLARGWHPDRHLGARRAQAGPLGGGERPGRGDPPRGPAIRRRGPALHGEPGDVMRT
jgi:acetylornithine deacetylase/succinyl-diaminopimelate desuccinylase-like protein